VAKAKALAVGEWVGAHCRGTPCTPVLLLSGPPGSGKRSLLTTALRGQGRTVVEDDDPYDARSADPNAVLIHTFAHADAPDRIEALRQFLSQRRADPLHCPSKSLPTSSNPPARRLQEVLVVRDLPYAHDPAAKEARDAVLTDAVASLGIRGHPIVFLFTISDTHAAAYQLPTEFPPALLRSPRVTRVEVIGITEARIRRRLQDVARLEGAPLPAPTIAAIAAGARGDIRAALLQAQWLARTTLRPPPVPRKRPLPPDLVAPTEGDDDPTSEGMSRDSYLNIGHANHRLLFAKRTPDGRLQHPPEQVAASVTVSEDKLLAYVVTSLPRFCPNVGGFSAALDAACEADVRMGCVPYARYTPSPPIAVPGWPSPSAPLFPSSTSTPRDTSSKTSSPSWPRWSFLTPSPLRPHPGQYLPGRPPLRKLPPVVLPPLNLLLCFPNAPSASSRRSHASRISSQSGAWDCSFSSTRYGSSMA